MGKWIRNWFSNFLPLDEPYKYDGEVYVTPEHFYQAMKSTDKGERAFVPRTGASAYAFVRDNFYDVKCCVMSEIPIEIPMGFAHREVDEEWIEKEIESYTGYKKRPRPEGDEWYKGWSSGEIIRLDGRIYRASTVHHVYCEGIGELGLPEEVFRVYRPGMKRFSVSLWSVARLAFVLECIDRSVEVHGYRREE